MRINSVLKLRISRYKGISDSLLQMITPQRSDKRLFCGVFICLKVRVGWLGMSYLLPDGLCQVINQVFSVFDTNAQTNQPVIESVFDAFFSGDRGMGHRSWMVNQ